MSQSVHVVIVQKYFRSLSLLSLKAKGVGWKRVQSLSHCQAVSVHVSCDWCVNLVSLVDLPYPVQAFSLKLWDLKFNLNKYIKKLSGAENRKRGQEKSRKNMCCLGWKKQRLEEVNIYFVILYCTPMRFVWPFYKKVEIEQLFEIKQQKLEEIELYSPWHPYQSIWTFLRENCTALTL